MFRRAQQTKVGMGDQIGRDRLEVGDKAPLALEIGSKLTADKIICKARHDATGNINTAASTIGQSEITRRLSDHFAE